MDGCLGQGSLLHRTQGRGSEDLAGIRWNWKKDEISIIPGRQQVSLNPVG